MGKVIQFPDFKQLQNQISDLRRSLAEKMAAFDEIRIVENRKIRDNYILTFGEIEYNIFDAECAILRLNRKIELIRDRKAHDQTIDMPQIESKLDREFAKQRGELIMQIEEITKSVALSQESLLTESEETEMNHLYVNILEVLHPDLYPDFDMDKVAVVNRAIQAYHDFDLDALRTIHAEMPALEPVTGTIADLVTEIKRLKKRLGKMDESINRVMADVPYCYKALLDNRENVDAQMSRYKEALAQYEIVIEELNREVDDLLK